MNEGKRQEGKEGGRKGKRERGKQRGREAGKEEGRRQRGREEERKGERKGGRKKERKKERKSLSSRPDLKDSIPFTHRRIYNTKQQELSNHQLLPKYRTVAAGYKNVQNRSPRGQGFRPRPRTGLCEAKAKARPLRGQGVLEFEASPRGTNLWVHP